MIDAVTFDFWNTLMWEEPGSLKRERLVYWADELGATVDGERLERAHDEAHRAYESAWRAGRQFRVDDAVALIVERLGDALPDGAAKTLAAGFSEGGRRAAIHPSDGVRECLQALHDAGVRLGIICDIGLTPSGVVRELLARHDLDGYFTAMTFSDEVGWYKPDPRIFAHALESVGGVSPSAAAHVGDRLRTDVGGAIAAGMTAVRYNRVYEDQTDGAAEAHFVTADLTRVPSMLGLDEAGR